MVADERPSITGGCIRMREAMVRHRGQWIAPSDLTDRSAMLRGRAWNIPKRPGMCVLRDCCLVATHSDLCAEHDRMYRLHGKGRR